MRARVSRFSNNMGLGSGGDASLVARPNEDRFGGSQRNQVIRRSHQLCHPPYPLDRRRMLDDANLSQCGASRSATLATRQVWFGSSGRGFQATAPRRALGRDIPPETAGTPWPRVSGSKCSRSRPLRVASDATDEDGPAHAVIEDLSTSEQRRLAKGCSWFAPPRTKLWLNDRIAGPYPETEADRIRRRSMIPMVFARRRWWPRRR